MAIYTAWNAAFSTTTGIAAGTSYATGAKCAIQLDVPATLRLQILEWGISFDAATAETPAVVELVQASAASTMTTAHTTSTVVAQGTDGAATSRLNYGTTADTGYGSGAITSNTTEITFDKVYVPVTGIYKMMWPLGNEPVCDQSKFVHLRINTTATRNALAFIKFRELAA